MGLLATHDHLFLQICDTDLQQRYIERDASHRGSERNEAITKPVATEAREKEEIQSVMKLSRPPWLQRRLAGEGCFPQRFCKQ